jgi:hypothetical protein
MSKRKIVCIACVLIPSITGISAAEGPPLKQIMQGLRDQVLEIADGLLLDDWDQVRLAAAKISDHPPIPEQQLALIVAELGPEMAGFEHFDDTVHELSLSLAVAARESNREQAINDYQRLLNGCFACHDAYKDRVAMALLAEVGH